MPCLSVTFAFSNYLLGYIMFLNHRRLFTIVVLVAGIICFSQDAFAQKKGRKKKSMPTPTQVMQGNLVQHVNVLAHDSLEGRRTGTEGERKAVNYISNQYIALGIGGAAKDGDYKQVFEIDEGRRFEKSSSFSINGKPLKPGEDYFPFPWSAEGIIETTSSVSLNESGDAWWVDIDPVIEKNGENPHFLLATHLQEVAKDAAGKGATAVIFYNSENNKDSLAYMAKDRSASAAIPVLFITHDALQKLNITKESAPEVEGRVAFEKMLRTGTNVVAGINNAATFSIVMGAHFDHLGYGEDANSRHTGEMAIHNGADDNASGTAALLELARMLKEKGDKRFNYLFLHFSGEELGLYGSKYFTENPTLDISKVSFMVNLDMVGRLNDSSKALTIGGIGTSPIWGQLLVSTPDFTFKIDSSGTGPSDHTSFYRKNIPVLFFFTGLHTDYHKPGDDADKINYAGIVKIVEYISGIVERAPADAQLAFTKTREQSMGGGRGFKVSMGIMPDYTFSGTGVKADGGIDGRAAQRAGLQANDVILQLGEHLITGVDTYMQALNRFEKGQTTTVVVKRGSEVKEFSITF
jgi:hypothetical protein